MRKKLFDRFFSNIKNKSHRVIGDTIFRSGLVRSGLVWSGLVW